MSGVVVVTGGAGRLGATLVARLVERADQVRSIDVRRPASPYPGVDYRVLDLGDGDGIDEALADADLVVHTASVHPWKRYDDRQYLRANVEATWHLYAAAERVGVDNVVLTSSTGAAGTEVPGTSWPVDVTARFPVTDLYSLTKRTQEDIAQTFAARGSVTTVALRPPGFIPLRPLDLGFALTRTFTILDEVVAAHLAAIDFLAGEARRPRDGAAFEAVFVTNRLPYTRTDGALFERTGDIVPLVKRHWPHAVQWLLDNGFTTTLRPVVYDLEPAASRLGWRPRFGFDEWFAANVTQAERRRGSRTEA